MHYVAHMPYRRRTRSRRYGRFARRIRRRSFRPRSRISRYQYLFNVRNRSGRRVLSRLARRVRRLFPF